MNQNFKQQKWFPIFIMVLALMLIYYTIGNFARIAEEISRFLWVASPLFYGILFSYFLFIPHHFIEKLFAKVKVGFIARKARLFSTLVVFLLLVALIVVVISFILPVLFDSAVDLITSIPGYLNEIIAFVEGLPEDSIFVTLNLVETATEQAWSLINRVFETGLIEQLAVGVINFAGEILNVVLGLVISLYMLLERTRIHEFFRSLSRALFKSEKTRDRASKYLHQINRVLFTFIASKGVDSVINFVVVTSILFIFDVPFALLLGIMAGVFNFIPYLGSLIAVILISLITLITGTFGKAIQVLIPLFIFQQLDGNFIEPRIMKSSLKISPILVIIAVVVGGAYFGIIGMFLAVPFAVIIKQILIEYISHSDSDKEETA
jgi:predicted PurR-regulated permease PerM